MRRKKLYQSNFGFMRFSNIKKKPVITEKINIESLDKSAELFDEYFKREAEREATNQLQKQEKN